MAAEDFARLELLCRRTSTLPVLPTTALQLIRSIDSGEASAAELERIIINDPALSAEFLRLASNSQFGKQTQVTSIRAGIFRLGQRTVRALATSLLVRDLAKSESSSPLDKKQFARHSLAVGLIARYLFARRKLNGEFNTSWTADEVFASGLLSDLGYVLIARMVPDLFAKLRILAERKMVTLDDMFIAVFGRPASALAAAAAETWNLPDIFSVSLSYCHAPWEHPEESTALSCITYAGALSRDFGLGIEHWPMDVSVPAQILFEVGMEDEERENLKSVILSQLDSFGEAEPASVGRAA